MNNKDARYMMISHATQLLLRHTNVICDALLKTGKFRGADAENLKAIIEMHTCMQRTIAQMPIEIEAPKFNGVSDATFTEIRLNRERGMYEIVETRMDDSWTEPIASPHDIGFTDKSSALKSIKQDIAKSYPFVMCYSCKDEMLTIFATLFMNYSNHDKRDVEIALKEIEHGRIHWRLVADHDILDEGIYIIDKDVPF